MNIISLDKSAHALFIKFPIIKPRKKSAPPIVVINPKIITICINIFCDFGKILDTVGFDISKFKFQKPKLKI